MPATLRFWTLSDTAPSPEGATFTRMSTNHEVIWSNRRLGVSTTHESGIGNRVRIPRLHFEGSRFLVAGEVLELMSKLVNLSSNIGAQDGTTYVVQHNLPTYTNNQDNDGITLKWNLSIAYSLFELSPHFNGAEMTNFRGTPLGYLRRLVDNMPAKEVTIPYDGPRPTRFERILEDD